MRNFRVLILLSALLMFNNAAQAQVEAIFYILNGLRGIAIGSSSKGNASGRVASSPRVIDFDITDINSLEGVISGYKNYSDYQGITVYNPDVPSDNNADIPSGLYMWNGAKWENAYAAVPAGNLKGDLQALYDIQHHPDNKGVKKEYNWDIDLENPADIHNMSLNGVFFKEINGEYRVVELRLDYIDYKDITITRGLEAVVYFSIFRNSEIENIDLKLPGAIYLNLSQNKLLAKVNLDCSRLILADLDRNSKLEIIQAKCPELYNFRCYGNNKLTELGFPECPNLTRLSVYENYLLASLDVSKNTKLMELHCHYNKLTTLDLSSNILLANLLCISNKLTSINISNSLELTSLVCYDNRLPTLDVSKNTKLTRLVCSINALTTLDVSNNRDLVVLNCDQNKLTKLDVTQNAVLEDLMCGSNPLKELDVTKNRALTRLWCGANELSALDISNNTALQSLNCSYNDLSSLDLSNHAEINRLECNFNNLPSLDLSNLRKLKELKCHSNKFKKDSVKICKSVVPSISSYFNPQVNSWIYQIIDCE